MKVDIQTIDFKPDRKLKASLQKKLDRYGEKYPWVVGAEVYLKALNTPDGVNKQVELKLNIPGNDLFVKVIDDRFIKAIDQADEVMLRQLKKFKEKDLIKPRVNPMKG